MTTKVKIVTPNEDSVIDDVNDAVRVNVVAGSGSGMSDTEFTAHLPLHVIVDSGAGSGTQYADAAARGTATGTLAMGDDGTNIQSVKVDTSGVLAIQDNGGSITVDGTVAATQSGTWTVQPGNTANTTAWKVDASSVAVPITDNAGSLTVDGSVTVTQATGTNLHTVIDSGTVSTITNVVHVDDNAGSLTVDGTVSITANSSVNVAQIAGTNTVTATAGVQKVGISGATAVTMDSADNAAAPANGIMSSGVYSTTIPALTSGNAGQIRLDSTGAAYANNEGRKATYSIVSLDQTVIASATAPSLSISGSGTKTVRVLKLGFSATAGTGGVATVNVRRYSALSGGVSGSPGSSAKHDSNNAASTATVNTWTSAATTATSAGIVRTVRFEFPTPAVTVQPQLYEWSFGNNADQSIVLRGAAEWLGICFSAVATTPIAEIYIEWTEE
jgi:hypothetical protein